MLELFEEWHLFERFLDGEEHVNGDGDEDNGVQI